MRLHYRLIFIFLIGYCSTHHLTAQTKTLAERLGYSKDAKLLIIHADDLGVSHSENMASIKGLEESPVNSASIMVPCPWFPEIATYAKKNKTMDLGLHLTLNSEWKHYKWAGVTSKDSITSLLNEDGYFYASVDSLINHANPSEVSLELRNQVKRAYAFDIDVTHLDTHMGAVIWTPELLEAYIKTGQEFQLPVLLEKDMKLLKHTSVAKLLTRQDVILDRILTAEPKDFDNGMELYYSQVIENLQPGVNCLLIHLAYDNAEMKAVTEGHKYWGSDWRQADFDFFTSKKAKELLNKHHIVLITWRQLRDEITRGEK